MTVGDLTRQPVRLGHPVIEATGLDRPLVRPVGDNQMMGIGRLIQAVDGTSNEGLVPIRMQRVATPVRSFVVRPTATARIDLHVVATTIAMIGCVERLMGVPDQMHDDAQRQQTLGRCR